MSGCEGCGYARRINGELLCGQDSIEFPGPVIARRLGVAMRWLLHAPDHRSGFGCGARETSLRRVQRIAEDAVYAYLRAEGPLKGTRENMVRLAWIAGTTARAVCETPLRAGVWLDADRMLHVEVEPR